MSCPDCFQGAVHEGKPRGTAIKLHGLDTYVVEPADGRTVKAIIVVIPDAFGWEFVNCRLLADTYANKGDYKVYMPDFMDGRPAPLYMMDAMKVAFTTWNPFSMVYNFAWAVGGFIPFILHNYPSKSFPRVKGFFSQLRKEEGVTLPIGTAGFCWGGKHAVFLANGTDHSVDGRPLIDAAFIGHPSLLSLPTDIDKMTLPVSFAIGDKDNQISKKKAEEIKPLVEERRGELRVYDNSTHGFCVRAVTTDEDTAKTATEAEDQAITWFNTHLDLAS